jgi:hypothetical protein
MLLNAVAFSQNKIEGNVIDNTGTPLEGIYILVSPVNGVNILAFAISDEKGAFSISHRSTLDSLKIRTRSLNFAEQLFFISNKSQNIHFVLETKIMELKEVNVQARPILRYGDTLDYTVNAFAGEKDRVLADVLKKMPGIDVGSDGRIYYQGEAIQKYYIDGLDLLEGKYAIANDNLPYSSVSTVQVLENHQPLRILQDIVPTDKASLNIKLKKNITTTGTAKAGFGFSPLLWDVNITPMLFAKKLQLIVSYQTNNMGDDVSRSLKRLTLEDLADYLDNQIDTKDELLNIKTIQSPSFSKNRYLFNNVHLLNFNYLVKLSKEYELRVNASYLNDYQQESGKVETTYFLPNDTLQLNEYIHNNFFFNSLQTNFTLNKNNKKIYLKNSLQIKAYWDSQNGLIESGESKIEQNLGNPYQSVSNKLRFISTIGKQLIEFSSVAIYSNAPQQLQVFPGQFEGILNNNEPYDESIQQANLYGFFTNNSLGISKGKNRLKMITKLGFQYQNQRLNTFLNKINNGVVEELDLNFQNHLNWLKTKYYVQTEFVHQTKYLKTSLLLPLSLLNYTISDTELQRGQKLNPFLFEPRLSLQYTINAFWKLGGRASYSNNFGSIRQINYGAILQNLHLMQIKDIPLPESQSQNYALKVDYGNPLSSVFAGMNYQHTFTRNNLIFQNQLQADGSNYLSAIQQKNQRISHVLTGRISKYISSTKTTLSLESSYNTTFGEEIINSVFSEIDARILSFQPRLNIRIFDWMSMEYKMLNSTFTRSINQQKQPNVNQNKHLLDLSIYPHEGHYLGVFAEYYVTTYSERKTENYFLDFIYRFSFSKKKIDIEAKWYNVLNHQNYSSFYLSSFMLGQTTYQLRPSQFMLSIKFVL